VPIFDDFCNKFCLTFVAANICVYFQYLFVQFLCANIFGPIVLKPRFKIDVVIMIICSIVIIINSVCSSTLDSFHTCVCAGPHRVRVRLSGLINGRNQIPLLGISFDILHKDEISLKNAKIYFILSTFRDFNNIRGILANFEKYKTTFLSQPSALAQVGGGGGGVWGE
jgi:hypothetical protein